MPIVHAATTQTGVTVNFHKATKLEVDMASDIATVTVVSYGDEQAYINQLPVAWSWPLNVPVALLSAGGTLLEDLELALTTLDGSPFQFGAIVTDDLLSLETIKRKKEAEITRRKDEADNGTFEFGGKQIRCTQASFKQMQAVCGWVGMTGELPVNFPNKWKATDKTMVSIPDVEAFKVFYGSMLATGIANFVKAETLIYEVTQCTTPEAVLSINWENRQ